MTYQEMFDKYQKEFVEASDTLLKLDKKLSSTNGFGDLSDIPEYQEAYKKWQIAGFNYYSFLSVLKGRNFNPNDEFSFL